MQSRLDEICRQEIPVDEKISELLAVGAEYLGAEYGYLSVVDQQADHWERVLSSADYEVVEENAVQDLSETYCRRTLDADRQLTIHDAPNQGLEDDPAFERLGYHCYVGTPVIVDGEQYGTVCFVATEPREEPYTDAEQLFAELVARTVVHELDSAKKTEQFRNQVNLTTVLTRVLRHNLRNNVTVIRGNAQAMGERLVDDSYSERIMANVDELIDLGDKARKLESVIDQTTPREPTDLGALAASVARRVETVVPAATITVDATGGITAVRPSFERALRELIENAAKHGSERPSVAVSIERTDTAVVIEITDDGPGLPRQERKVLQNEAETPLVHGSGLGLWIAHWVVTNHGGRVGATVTADGTTLSVSIPHSDDPVPDSTPSDSQLPRLTRARDQYRAAFDESNEAMMILDDDAHILDANETAAAFYETDKTELRGRLLSTVVPESVDFNSRWESFTTNGTARGTLTVVDTAGEKRVVEYAATADVVPGQHLLIAHDITDRIEREAELRTKTRAMDNAPIGITISDPAAVDNPLIYANDQFCEQFGYDRSETLGRNCRFVQGQDTDPETVERIRQAIDNEEPITETLRNYRKDGTMFWTRLTIAPVEDEQGALTNYVGFQREVTAEIERDRELQQMAKRLDVWKSLR